MTENSPAVDFTPPTEPVYGFVCQFCKKLNRNPRPQVLNAMMINDVVQQALNKSRAITRANAQHQVFGATPNFPYRLEDLRFIQGGPIDALCFEGLFENRNHLNVILGDRKTGWSNANSRQKKIAEAIDEHCGGDKDRVRFELFGDRQPERHHEPHIPGNDG